MTRARLTKPQRQRLLAAHGHACAICGTAFEAGQRVELDHALPLALGGADAVGNLRPLCVPCHARKTRTDIGSIRKADRQRRKDQEGRGRKRRGPPLRGRGFAGWRKFDGTVVRRV